MDVAQTNGTASSNANASTAASSSSNAVSSSTEAGSQETTANGTVISSDFETFLTMLTVQMQNQDPMNPMDSTDFAVQLATFSGVEQQVRTNDLLAGVSNQLGAMSMSDLAGWVGMEARAKAPAWFSGSPLTLQPEPASGAERTFVVVQDAAGNEVDRVEIPVSNDSVAWAGVDALGQPYPEGLYSFYLESRSADRVLSVDQMGVFSDIVEAQSRDGETVLVLAGGSEVPASEVDALRTPERATTN